jgi:peptide/nickel transport system permease protein
MAESTLTLSRRRLRTVAAAPFARTSILGRLLRIKLALFAFVVIGVVTVAGVIGPALAPYEPQTLVTFSAEGPSSAHWLGTDELGRDQLSRLLYGARASLMVSTLAMLIGVSSGSLLGLVSAYFGGIVDSLIMRWVDAVRAVPGIILPLMLLMIVGGSILTVSFALGFGLMTGIARLMRGQALAMKARDHVLAATSLGATGPRIMMRHIAPNCWSPIIVAASLGMSGAISAEAGLSFLGIGIKPPTATWGQMLSTGLAGIRGAPWQVIAPGLSIFLLVLAFNFLGDALRDVLDPRLRGEGVDRRK